jgi:hypothetical protein
MIDQSTAEHLKHAFMYAESDGLTVAYVVPTAAVAEEYAQWLYAALSSGKVPSEFKSICLDHKLPWKILMGSDRGGCTFVLRPLGEPIEEPWTIYAPSTTTRLKPRPA